MLDDDANLKACRDMVAFHGIDPDAVVDVGESGYVTAERDRDKFSSAWFKFDENGDLIETAHAWPINFPVASFFEHYWAWKKATV